MRREKKRWRRKLEIVSLPPSVEGESAGKVYRPGGERKKLFLYQRVPYPLRAPARK
jgi:hypothetical protein